MKIESKVTYTKAEVKKIMLDFYLKQFPPAQTGYELIATSNYNDGWTVELVESEKPTVVEPMAEPAQI